MKKETKCISNFWKTLNSSIIVLMLQRPAYFSDFFIQFFKAHSFFPLSFLPRAGKEFQIFGSWKNTKKIFNIGSKLMISVVSAFYECMCYANICCYWWQIDWEMKAEVSGYDRKTWMTLWTTTSSLKFQKWIFQADAFFAEVNFVT